VLVWSESKRRESHAVREGLVLATD